MNKDEKRVKNLLEDRGCSVQRIVEDPKGQKPDFLVKADNMKFYCEVKSIDGDSILNSISKKIHKSVKQFNAVNSNIPNALVLCSHNDNDWINSLDLIAVLTSNFYTDDGNKHKIYGLYSDGRIKKEKFNISLYVWLTKDDRIVSVFTDENGKKIMTNIFRITNFKKL